MEKHVSGLFIVLSALFLLVGGLVGYSVGEAQEIERIVEKIVTKNVEVPVEVPVEVEVIKEVEKDFDAYKQTAVDLCLEEFLDDIDLDRYQEAEVRDVSDEWTIEFDLTRRDKEKTTITINEITFRVYDTLDDTRETYDKECKVIYEEDKDTKVVLN